MENNSSMETVWIITDDTVLECTRTSWIDTYRNDMGLIYARKNQVHNTYEEAKEVFTEKLRGWINSAKSDIDVWSNILNQLSNEKENLG